MGSSRCLRAFVLAAMTAILAPMAILLFWSFGSRWPWPALLPTGFSLRGVGELLSGGALRVLFSSVILSLGVALFSAVIGAMTARALVLYDFPGKRFFSFSGILPLLLPGTAFAMGIHVVMIRIGLADTYLGVLVVHLICALPYSVSIMLDVTRSVGTALEDQAKVLGAGPWRAFFHATLPALTPGMLSAAAMGFITSYSQYFLTLLIGGGRVKTLSLVMVPFIQGSDRTLACAYSLLFLLSALAVFGLFARLEKQERRGR